MYSDIQRRIINTLDEMQYTPPTLQFNNDNTDPYDCFTCPGGEKPPKEEFEAKTQRIDRCSAPQGTPPRTQQAPRRGGLDFLFGLPDRGYTL